MRKSGSGFTLVELLIVIVVIAILAAITIVAYNGVQDRAIASSHISDIEAYQKLLTMYYIENGSYPSTGGSWTYQRVSGANFAPGLIPTYASALPAIPESSSSNYHNTYIYRSNGVGYEICYLDQDQTPARGFNSVDVQYKGSYTDRYGIWTSPYSGCG